MAKVTAEMSMPIRVIDSEAVTHLKYRVLR